MYSLTIKNLSTNEILEGYVSSVRPFSKEVEEHLYNQWDLTPCGPTVGLLSGEVVRFSYHNVEFFDVWVEDGTGIVFVCDADLDLDFDDCDYEVGFDPYCGCYTDDC
jgi:hypothetical protein